MKIDNARDIIRKQVTKRGYRLEERKSSSTDSWYFKIYSDNTSLLFRISNHSTKANVITLRIDQKTTPRSLEGFINNRCDDLSYRKVKALLHM